MPVGMAPVAAVERDPPRAAPRRVRGPAHASGPKHGTWSRHLRSKRAGSLSPVVPSAGERKFGATRKRPGDATTSRGMAPKGEFGAHPRYASTQPAHARKPSAATEERNAMAQVAVEVPAALVHPLRETVLLLYRAAVEALHFALGAHEEPRATLEEVVGQRERVRQLDAVLDQLGWPEPVGTAGRTLAGPAELLADALHGALIDAGERLAVACSGSWRGEASADSVRAAAREVIELDRLVRAVEGGR